MKRIAVDTETFLISPGVKAPKLVCISWAYSKDECGLYHRDHPGLEDIVRKWFETSIVVGANFSFDAAVLMNAFPRLTEVIFKAYEEGRVICIQAAEKINDIRKGCFRIEEDEHGDMKRKGYSLSEMVWRHLQRKMEKDIWRMKYHLLDKIPIKNWPKDAQKYAITDAVETKEVDTIQQDPKKYKYNTYVQEICRHDFALHLASCRGLVTDPEQVALLKVRTQEKVDALQDILVKKGWIYRNDKVACGWSKKVTFIKEYFCSTTIPPTYTKKGLDLCSSGRGREVYGQPAYVSLAFSVLAKCGDEALESYGEWNRLTNLLNSVIVQMEHGRICPIQTRFDSCLATTRSSSSGPNVQNVRTEPGAREVYHSRRGYAFGTSDLPTAELRGLAQTNYDLFGMSAQGDALNNGEDLHSSVGAQIIGISYEAFMQGRVDDPAKYKPVRQEGKRGNFTFPGGGGAARFADMNKKTGMSIQRAAQIKDAWLERWPEMSRYFDMVNKCRMPNSPLHYSFIRRLGVLRSNCSYPQACNTHFQGIVAGAAKRAFWELMRDSNDRYCIDFYGCFPVNFIHDEIITEFPLEKLHVGLLHQEKVLMRCFNKLVPDCPATSISSEAMYRWSKDAEPVFDRSGIILPFERSHTDTVYKADGSVYVPAGVGPS